MKTETKTETAKHTPGPWQTFRDSTCMAVLAQDRSPICNLTWATTGMLYRGTIEDSEANAALIAAAPDLLEALREADKMLDIAKRYFPRSIKNGDKFDLLNVQENVVRKAIAQAEGREEGTAADVCLLVIEK